MSFSSKHNLSRPLPSRNLREVAPPFLRTLLTTMMTQSTGDYAAYARLSDLLYQTPDNSGWGSDIRERLEGLMDDLEWYYVFDLLEEFGKGYQERINEVFANLGLAYEMRDGEIEPFDPEAEAIGVAGIELKALDLLTGRFEPIHEQYELAVNFLHARPANREKAVSEALNALEAVARVITGKKDFGDAVATLFATRAAHTGGLRRSLQQLYGWASEAPGVRHARTGDPDLTFEDAWFAVRAVGVAIVYFTGHAGIEIPVEKPTPVGNYGDEEPF